MRKFVPPICMFLTLLACTPTATPAEKTDLTPYNGLVLNEIAAHDQTADAETWVEILNTSSSEVALKGLELYITDEYFHDQSIWKAADGAKLGAGERMVLSTADESLVTGISSASDFTLRLGVKDGTVDEFDRSKVAKENSDKNLEFAKMSIAFDICIEVIIGITMSVLMGCGAYFVYRTVMGLPVSIFGHVITLSAGKLTTFIGYVDTLIWPMIAMGQILQMHSRFKTSSGRIYAFLDQEEEIHNAENAVVLKDCKGKITFKDFSFAYPDGDTHSLKNVTFEIQPGEMVGLVGKIGSGKTTLVNTLLRLYNIEKGKIFIDDIDLMDIDITSLRDAIAYVPQDNFLFSDNIKNNISFANNKADMNDIRNAAKFADVDDNILGFSEGYETVTGERGVTLSGGQKQRISIARAYMKNAPIMIMDDSVSAVDVKTEETILNNINEKRKGKTTIIIASRVSTVAHMDKILVLNDGCVEAFDTPANLLNTSPTYQKMVYLQKLESEL